MITLRLIGYWASEREPGWPDVTEFVDEAWDDDEREDVRAYLARGTIARAYIGYSPCRICGVNNGALEYTDGTYIWPEGLAHYIDEHGSGCLRNSCVTPSAEIARIEEAEVDLSWWRGQAGRL